MTFIQDNPVTGTEATVGNVIDLSRRLVLGAQRAEWNRLGAALDSSSETVTFDFAPDGIARGNYICIDDEVMFVWETNAGTKQSTVQRGMFGTTAAAHTLGKLVEVNPRFPKPAIRQAIRDEIRSWGPQLYAVSVLEVTPTTSAVDLAGITDLYNILRVEREPYSADDGRWVPIQTRLLRDAGVADFSSGLAVLLDAPLATGTRIRISMARKFPVGTLDDSTDLQATVGIASSMLDILPMGVAWRLMVGREISRTQAESQGLPRNAAEIPPGHLIQTAQSLRDARDKRIGEEAMKLAMRYPPLSLR